MSVSASSFNPASEDSSGLTSSGLPSIPAVLQPSCNQAHAWLHQMVGYGRFGTVNGVVLKLSATPDFDHPPTLCPIALTLEGQRVCAWVSQAAWLDWLEPVFPVSDLRSLASDMQEVALNWTLAPWFDWCASHQLATPSLNTQEALGAPTTLEAAVPLTLSLISSHNEQPRCLTLYLEKFSTDWLHGLAQSLAPIAPAAAGKVEGYAIVGINRLTVAQMRGLSIGDVLMFGWQTDLEAGTVWLTFAPTSPTGFTRGMILRRVRSDEESNQFEVESVMEDYQEEQEGQSSFAALAKEGKAQEAHVVDTLPITLTFEIGRMTLPLSSLTTLQVGDVLNAEFAASPEIGIRAQGRLIAAGKLVQIGENLGAKVTRLLD